MTGSSKCLLRSCLLGSCGDVTVTVTVTVTAIASTSLSDTQAPSLSPSLALLPVSAPIMMPLGAAAAAVRVGLARAGPRPGCRGELARNPCLEPWIMLLVCNTLRPLLGSRSLCSCVSTSTWNLGSCRVLVEYSTHWCNLFQMSLYSLVASFRRFKTGRFRCLPLA